MSIQWNEKDPIYVQIHQHLVGLVIDGAIQEGDPLPSVRAIAETHRVNPLTASKAIQRLVDDDVLEKRRGLGMYLVEGARERLLQLERKRFIEEEWPVIKTKLAEEGKTRNPIFSNSCEKYDLVLTIVAILFSNHKSSSVADIAAKVANVSTG